MSENKLQSKFFISYNNCKFPISYSPLNIDFALNYKPLDSDRIIVTYPKCGTTWTQQIIGLILNDGKPQKDKNFLNTTCIEYKGNEFTKTPIIKTHLAFNLLPFNKSTKYFYVLRNPKDVCVSYFNHLKMRFDYDFHTFFDNWIVGQIPYGDYFEHLNSFWWHRFDNFCSLIYEQMKSDPKEAVIKIGEFLGQRYVRTLKADNELVLKEVLKYSSLEYMRSELSEYPYIVRKGITGDWKQYFSKRESDSVDRRFEAYFSGTELESIWRPVMNWF